MKIENCGSFYHHGLYGSMDDLLTRVYLSSGRDDAVYPTLVKMSRDVFEFYIRARGRTDRPHSNPAGSTIAEFVLHLSSDEGKPAKSNRLYDADVLWSKDVPDGTALFYIGDELVGETTGWIA